MFARSFASRCCSFRRRHPCARCVPAAKAISETPRRKSRQSHSRIGSTTATTGTLSRRWAGCADCVEICECPPRHRGLFRPPAEGRHSGAHHLRRAETVRTADARWLPAHPFTSTSAQQPMAIVNRLHRGVTQRGNVDAKSSTSHRWRCTQETGAQPRSHLRPNHATSSGLSRSGNQAGRRQRLLRFDRLGLAQSMDAVRQKLPFRRLTHAG